MEDGTFVVLLGPNGAGKSTLLKCMMGLLDADGTVLIDHCDISKLSRIETARLRSTVLADRIYPFNMTVREIILLGRYPYHSGFGNNKIDEKMIFDVSATLGIIELLDKQFATLSDGQKQKVLIARALAQKPRVLILDEPVTHLDANARIEILLKLKDIVIQNNITVFASMHEIEIAYRISDKIVVLDNGVTTVCGSTEKIFENGLIDSVYKNQNSTWNKTFGTLEIKPPQKEPLIHVVAGFGTGIPIFRHLAKKGIPFSTGVLDKIDVDYYLASSVSSIIFSNNEPYLPLKYNARTLEQIKNVRLILDSGFPVTEQTSSNVCLIKDLSKMGIPVFSFRDKKEIQSMDLDAKEMTISELQNIISKLEINTK